MERIHMNSAVLHIQTLPGQLHLSGVMEQIWTNTGMWSSLPGAFKKSVQAAVAGASNMAQVFTRFHPFFRHRQPP